MSPFCDCHSENDAPIIPDVGMFASFDLVALDKACADAANAMPPIRKSWLGDRMSENDFCDKGDHFHNSMADTDWKVQLEHAEKLGLGSMDYEIITV